MVEEEIIKQGMILPMKKVGNSFAEIIDSLASKITAKIEIATLKTKYSEYVFRQIGTFPLFATNVSANIEKIYFPLKFSNEIGREKYRELQLIKSSLLNNEVNKTSNYSNSIFKIIEASSNKFCLVADAGHGKSTVFKHIAFEAAKGKKISGKTRFPIFISLKDIERKKQSISDFILNFFTWLDFEVPKEVIEELLSKGKCIILLDGLDEVDPTFQRQIINEFSDITYKYSNNIYCINARPYCLKAALNNFSKWEIKPLEIDEQIKFIQNWYSNISVEKGNDLILKIEDHSEVLSVGSSPFYLSLICALHLNGLDVYKRSEELIDRCIDGILGQWDHFRNIARKSILKEFSINQRKLIASHIAASLFDKNKLIFTINDLVQSKCLKQLSKKFREELPDEEKLIISLYNDFSIITKQAPSIYSYSHLSIQEYLTAIYIRDNRRELDVAHKLFNDDKYTNVLYYLIRLLPDTNELLKRFLHYLDFSNLSQVRKVIEILALQPICSEEIINKFLNEIIELLKHSESKTKSFIRLNVVNNNIEVLINYNNANRQLSDAISIMTSTDENDPDLIENLFETKDEFNFFGKIAICLASLKELINVLIKNRKELKINKKYPSVINEIIAKEINSINSIEYIRHFE